MARIPEYLLDGVQPTPGQAMLGTINQFNVARTTAPTAVSDGSTSTDANRPPKPGAAYIWGGNNWMRPPAPGPESEYNWDNDKGWIKKTAPDSGGKKIKSYQRFVDPISGAEYGIPVYEDGTTETDRNKWVLDYFKKQDGGGDNRGGGGPTLVSTYTDPNTGDIVATYSDGSTKILSKGTYLSDRAKAEAEAAAQAKAGRQSAYDLLYQQFNQYGLGSLVTPLKGLIESGISPSEFTLKLRETEAYKKRFAANQGRIAKGLRALSEAEYIGLEDQYQNVMRQYGLPASYYAKGDMGVQPGFEKFLAGDVSPAELEDRIQTAQNRVINAAPEVTRALKQFYPDITNGDILAYALDPEQALTTLKRKVTAAEIGGAALQAGLETGLTRAEELQKYGVTGQAAQQGFQTIAGYLPRATQLSDIYTKQGMGQYTQTTAEQEVFGLPSAAEAATKRKRLSELEQAAFSGQAGRAGGALGRERAGQF